MRFRQLMSSVRRRISFTSAEMGRTLGRKLTGSWRYAWNVGSEAEADFHGLRPVIRLRRIIPRDHMSLKGGEYVPLGAKLPP
jgi:hypothetical protein